MKKLLVWVAAPAVLASALALTVGVRGGAAPKVITLKTDKDKVSYLIGFSVGSQLRRDTSSADEIDVEVLAKGIRSAMAGEKLAVSEEEAARVMQAFQQSAQAAREKRAREAAEKNKKEGEAFLAANKKKPGVVALPSGLQYKVLKEGTGKSPKATDMVTVHYRGTLIDGTEFDSSYSRNEPATFEVGQIIPGWVEALQLMKAGAKWQLFIPSELAYGEQGAGPQIGPNSVLLFEVELLSIGQPEATQQPEK
ncbi:MAG TPA: FKBP-type peptidyl-prolyl cis-trans isomerase [Armatimonadetes bacterium]|jgi:FKBP-type peptidyl-prolyl cis-trans isomerase FklB|nr:FKBP-type peptidyl-prolyl cis-trans isomerase [Armatimonadota bacterium]